MQKLGVGVGGGSGGAVGSNLNGLFQNSGALGGGMLAPTFSFSGIYSR
jgi:hypothetical protein